jgi:phage tail-like protein
MTAPRPYALVTTCDQWSRCAFEQATIDRAEGTVELARRPPPPAPGGTVAPAAGGLAFDAACRLYHSRPREGAVERVLWGRRDPSVAQREEPAPLALFAQAPPPSFGDFAAPASAPSVREPRGMAVDRRDRLWIAETGADRILVYDLWDSRLLATVRVPGERPTSLAAYEEIVYATLAGSGRLVTVSLRTGVAPVSWPPGYPAPDRVAASESGRIAVLAGAGSAEARIVLLDGRTDPQPVPLATDVAWESAVTLVVAGQPGADFLRFNVEQQGASALGPLRARDYDGGGIAAAPRSAAPGPERPCRCGGACGQQATPRPIVYWSARGPRTAVAARLVYAREGRVVTYRLDSGTFQSEWGRLFLDACIPEGTGIRVRCLALDEVEDEPALARTPPVDVSLTGLPFPDRSPPMPPSRLASGDDQPLAMVPYRRDTGREIPWCQLPAGDPFRTYEMPIDAWGRYLWLTLDLSGNTQVTPKVRSLRAEHARHELRAKLPRTYSREARLAAFLDRYLALPDGFLQEMDARSEWRHALLHPDVVPDRLLAWLASFVGLVLDDRWARAPRPGGRTTDARRAILAAVAELWRGRGTVPGLRRFLELYVGLPVMIVEQFKLRGLAGAGAGAVTAAGSVLGGGFRIGAPIGETVQQVIGASADDAFAANAHRFTVLIPMSLEAEQLDVVRHILEVHRPAHTLVEVCTVDAGMRVGRGLHLELSSIVGPTGGFGTAQLGRVALGRGAIVGRPPAAGAVGGTAASVRLG